MATLNRVNALIIDDDPEAVLLMGMRLNEACAADQRFVLEGAETLHAGLAEIARGDYDVILLDLTLPDSRGLDTVAATVAKAGGVPVVVLTNLEDEAVGGAGAHLAREDAAEDPSLGRGRPRRELPEARRPGLPRPGAPGLGDRGEGLRDVAERERGAGRAGWGVGQTAHAEDAGVGGGERPARQEDHRRPGLPGREPCQELREERELREPPRGALEPMAQLGELPEIVPLAPEDRYPGHLPRGISQRCRNPCT